LGEYPQVTEKEVTEPGLQAGSPLHMLTCAPCSGGDTGAAAVRITVPSGCREPVTVWTIQSLADMALGSYFVQVLNELGYRASLRRVPLDRFFAASADSRNKIQMGLFGWGADFPAAGDFFLPRLELPLVFRGPTYTGNLAEYCDPRADELASRAQAAQLTNPAAAWSLWAQVDRIVTDKAPWVPILNESLAGFVSSRVGNYQQSPGYAYLVDQMWVR